MRTTVSMDRALLNRASELTGVKQRNRLVEMALKAIIARERGRRLAELGGTEKQLTPICRRKRRSRLAPS